MQRFAVGKEIVYNEYLIVGAEPLLAHQQRYFLFICIGEYLAFVQAAFDIVALGLFGENHGHAEFLGTDGGKRYSAGLYRKHGGDAGQIKKPTEFLCHFPHKFNVHAVVQKSVDLNNVAGPRATISKAACTPKTAINSIGK